MGVKESMKNVAARIGMQAQDMREQMRPEWSDFGDYYKGMVQNENQRGYSPETVNAMRGNATGALVGARRSAMQDVNRNIAASGMGNTGMGIRSAMNMGRNFMSQQRGANRDVDLAQAEAKRNDLWNATQAWQQGLGGEQSAIMGAGQLEGMQIPALTGASNAGFWGNFSDIGGTLAKMAGAGAAYL